MQVPENYVFSMFEDDLGNLSINRKLVRLIKLLSMDIND